MRIMKILKKNKRRIKTLKYNLLIVVLSIIILAVLIDARIEPIIKTVAQNQAGNLATGLVDSAVADVLSSNDFSYSDLVELIYDSEGRVAAIIANSVKTNQLKTAIGTAVSEYIGSVDRRRLSIPIGTLSGIEYLSGRGRRIGMYISLSGSAKTEIKNEFASAGINQTRHQIFLEITTHVNIIMSGENTSTGIVSNVLISETVIVGQVPEIFAEAEGELWQNMID